MGIASLILTLGLASGAPAAESWQFVLVSRGTDLTVREGTATLARSDGVITGVMRDTRTVEYSLNLTIQGGDVSGSFGAIESDDGGTLLSGTLRQWQVPGGECWQTMQLSDGYSSVSLARNVPACEA
jgi:hypothetical protein